MKTIQKAQQELNTLKNDVIEYNVKIYENNICISTNNVSKEMAIRVQDTLRDEIDYEKIITAVLRWSSVWEKYKNGNLKDKPMNTLEFIEYLKTL